VMDKKNQQSLFECKEAWEEHWQGMPEFVQEDQSPFNEIVIKFRNRKDMENFMNLVDQKFTRLTKSIWFLKLEITSIKDKRYVVG
jgi:hypothetical protein